MMGDTSILFLNLPNKERIQRRYMCSYNTPTFLFQPVEMLSLAAIAREWKSMKPSLLDAIAEGKTQGETLGVIKELNPNIIVSISGFECFEDDMNEIKAIKEEFEAIPVVLFGHYATEFPKEIMSKIPVDYIIHGEPDLIFSELMDSLKEDLDIESIKGISYRVGDDIIHQFGAKRIPDPNQLPMPAFDLLKNHLYSEPFFPQPYALLQSARGCPYQCNYCVKSFGTKLTALTPENTMAQLERNIELFNIKSFRFIDDTFTAVPKRVIDFCKLLIEKDYRLRWSCLSRPDTLNAEMLEWMRKAGCTRLYIGMESGSQKVLDFYNKKIDKKVSMENILKAKELGFELMGFFMVGAPGETKEDLDESINFSIKAGFNFVDVTGLTPYPGTALFKKMENQLDFSLLPYKNEFVNDDQEVKAYMYQKKFFRRFYIRPTFAINLVRTYLFKQTRSVFATSYNFLKYLFLNTFFRKRKDYI